MSVFLPVACSALSFFFTHMHAQMHTNFNKDFHSSILLKLSESFSVQTDSTQVLWSLNIGYISVASVLLVCQSFMWWDPTINKTAVFAGRRGSSSHYALVTLSTSFFHSIMGFHLICIPTAQTELQEAVSALRGKHRKIGLFYVTICPH